jgi:hypothetical protein
MNLSHYERDLTMVNKKPVHEGGKVFYLLSFGKTADPMDDR